MFFPACGGHHFCFHPHRRYPCHQLPHCPSVATALQLRQGFNRTLLLSVLFSFIDIMGGLVISYELGAAPGGITAILSVILLVAVLIYQEIQDHLQGGERR